MPTKQFRVRFTDRVNGWQHSSNTPADQVRVRLTDRISGNAPRVCQPPLIPISWAGKLFQEEMVKYRLELLTDVQKSTVLNFFRSFRMSFLPAGKEKWQEKLDRQRVTYKWTDICRNSLVIIYTLGKNWRSPPWEGLDSNLDPSISHLSCCSPLWEDLNSNLWPSKSRSRPERTIFAIIPLNNKCKNLEMSFFYIFDFR